MNDLLTSRQVQEILKVDRITVYRMLQDGRLKGVKIGQQWRFPQSEVERLLGGPAGEATPSETGAAQSAAKGEAAVLEIPSVGAFPTHCVQTIQDLFSQVSQLCALVVDPQGQPMTEPSQMCALYQALTATPAGKAACLETWRGFAAHAAAGSKFFTCHAGLNYVAAPIYDNGELVGVFLTGHFYWQAPDAREEAERLRRLADTYNLPLETLQEAARCIPVIPPDQHERVEAWPFSAANAVHSILKERSGFLNRLQRIATLTQIS